MDKPICNSVQFHAYCVQPIHIENQLLIKLFGIRANQAELNSALGDKPTWYDEFNSELYQSILPIKLDKLVSSEELVKELASAFKVGETYSLADYIDQNKTCFYLLFDQRLVYFNLVFEIAFHLPIEELPSLLQQFPERTDLYNTIRNMVVQETSDSLESRWSASAKQAVKNQIKTLLKKVYQTNILSDDLMIEASTGNISLFMHKPEIQIDNNSSKLCEEVIKLNNFAERLPSDDAPIVLQGALSESDQSSIFSKELYHFNGRFHTIIHKDTAAKDRYMPIQFHMQFMWFYLKKINTILEQNYNDLLFCNKLKHIESHSSTTDHLINKIETLIMHNEKFKLTIEADNDRIYQVIQSRWNIENLLSNSNRYVSYFKEHLNRLYTKKSAKAEQRQNSTLLFITLLQFIALISVWNDYLSLLKADVVKEADELTGSIISEHLLQNINLFLPIGFLVFIIVLLIYVFKKPD